MTRTVCLVVEQWAEGVDDVGALDTFYAALDNLGHLCETQKCHRVHSVVHRAMQVVDRRRQQLAEPPPRNGQLSLPLTTL